MDYWCYRNFSTEEDKTILAQNLKTRKRYDAYLSDTQLRQLHQDAVTWREKTLETALSEKENRALLGRLMITPPSQPMPARFAYNLRQFS